MEFLFNECDTDGDEHLDSDELGQVLQQTHMKRWEPAAASFILRQMARIDCTAVNVPIVKRAAQGGTLPIMLLCAIELQSLSRGS